MKKTHPILEILGALAFLALVARAEDVTETQGSMIFRGVERFLVITTAGATVDVLNVTGGITLPATNVVQVLFPGGASLTTNNLLAAWAAATNDCTVNIGPGNWSYTGSQVDMSYRTNLTIIGYGSPLLTYTSTNQVSNVAIIRFDYGGGLRMQGLRYRAVAASTYTNTVFVYALSVSHSTNAVIRDCQIQMDVQRTPLNTAADKCFIGVSSTNLTVMDSAIGLLTIGSGNETNQLGYLVANHDGTSKAVYSNVRFYGTRTWGLDVPTKNVTYRNCSAVPQYAADGALADGTLLTNRVEGTKGYIGKVDNRALFLPGTPALSAEPFPDTDPRLDLYPGGAPGVVAASTGSRLGVGVTSITNSLTVSGTNTMMVWAFDCYQSPLAVNLPTWNGSSAGVTRLTNAIYQTAGDSRLFMYYLANPQVGAHVSIISFGGTVYNLNSHVLVLTNVSAMGAATTNYQESTVAGGGITNSIAHANQATMLFYTVLNSGPIFNSFGTIQVSVGYTNSGPGNSSSAISSHDTGPMGVVTNSAIWTGTGVARGSILANVIGIQADRYMLASETNLFVTSGASPTFGTLTASNVVATGLATVTNGLAAGTLYKTNTGSAWFVGVVP